MNYKQQLEVVTGLFVPPETQMRMDCPFCNNKNTFTVDTMNSNLNWYCFHASCKARGKKEGEKNMNYVTATFAKETKPIADKFILPESFTSVFSSAKAMDYLHKNNCWEAWAWHRADIKYDVKQNRVVFLIKNRYSNEYAGAVGRALNKNDYPKWFMYGTKTIPFKSGNCDDAVIVEDCASACAVSNILTGIAIMGTSIKSITLDHINPYKNLYICLDRDATTKSYEIANTLKSSGFQNVFVKPLTDDLKYFNTDEIRELFYGKRN